MSTITSPDVAASVRAAMGDPEFKREIRYFTGALKIAVPDRETVARFQDGSLINVGSSAEDALPDEQCQIVVRGDDEHWTGMLAEYPVPFFQCLQTANIKHGLFLSKNPLSYAYLPALNRLVALMRADAVKAA